MSLLSLWGQASGRTGQASGRTRRRWVARAGLGLVLALAGCSSGTPPTTGPTFAAPRPAGVQDPAVIPSTSAGPAANCNPLASLRPGALPAAGSMPAGSTMATIASHGRLTVGVDQNTFLFGFRNATTGEIEGFDIDIAKQVAAAIFGTADGHLQLVAITSAQRIPYVSSGKVDMVADTMTMNCARWQQVNFSSQYYEAGQRVLVPKSSTVTGIADLGGKKVCAAAGSTSIVNIADAKPAPIPVSVNDWTDCLVLLQQGQVAAVSTDDTILAGLAAQDPTVKLVGGPFTSEPYGLAIAKPATDFTRFVNAVLAKIRGDGTWSAIYQRWLGGTATAPAAQYQD
jgi:polar amino acid transport system substrate-binding protein